ncbi:MAG: thioredoxin domain-containing protein [Synergistaceae bacterium]|nr:thioredoxin domain-containing protein [Synergistaceae bacterium]
MMPPTDNNFINELGYLAAYGEYSEETAAAVKKKSFVPVNHLANETSPYLLQHAANPVGWYPWGSEAFETAQREDRPVFLSIGYSSEHWCGVMNRECFSDVEVAGFMNEICIPVKVDREEHPELDNLFMEVCRIQNGSAGWPLNIFLLPDGRPFFCTTWLPKRTTGQMPGLTDLLPRIKWLWTKQRDDVERAANELYLAVSQKFELLSGSKSRTGGRIGKLTTYEALSDIRRIFDLRWGGFGKAPKFPEPNKLLFLLKQAEENSGASKRDRSDALTMVDITLRRMWRGGIHDHLGGGFSRYAIDERWLVPHFEKLLCDQAMILLTVAKAQELNQNSFHRLMAEDIIFCLTRDFSDSSAYSQGFRAAIGGDTPEGEGRYYLWNEDELKKILPEGDAGLFCAAYAVLPSGNFGNELAGSQMSWNILYEASTVNDLAKRYNIKGSEVGRRLYECRKILLNVRDKRYPLASDNKILMGWNGLAIGALARASVAFEQSEWRDIAERAALFIQKNFPEKNNSDNWLRCWIDGHAKLDAIAEDYAFMLWGIMELYKAAKHFNAGEKQLSDWLKTAQTIADIMIKKFWDEKNGGLFLSAENAPNVFIRMKSAEDNSLPSANAFAVVALNELAIVMEEKNYSDYARKIIGCFSRYAAENSLACLSLVTADSMWIPVRKKPAPAPEPVHIPTDEELNAEEPATETAPPAQPETDRRAARASRRSARSGTAERPERSERRGTRPHRSARTREK